MGVVGLTFTFKVKSAQVPCTPSTRACPPSIPCVPTSRATRVTSDAKALSWSTIEFTVDLSVAISPSTWISILRVKSPCATAVVTVAIDRTWSVKLEHIRLTWTKRQALKKRTTQGRDATKEIDVRSASTRAIHLRHRARVPALPIYLVNRL